VQILATSVAPTPDWRLAVVLLALVAVAVAAIPSAVLALRHLDRTAARRAPFSEAMAAIRADAAGAPCLVFSTETPMVTWYTGCRAIQVETWGLDPARATGTHVYLLEARGLPRSIGDTEARTRPPSAGGRSRAIRHAGACGAPSAPASICDFHQIALLGCVHSRKPFVAEVPTLRPAAHSSAVTQYLDCSCSRCGAALDVRVRAGSLRASP
jgi:hypothetical protein